MTRLATFAAAEAHQHRFMEAVSRLCMATTAFDMNAAHNDVVELLRDMPIVRLHYANEMRRRALELQLYTGPIALEFPVDAEDFASMGTSILTERHFALMGDGEEDGE